MKNFTSLGYIPMKKPVLTYDRFAFRRKTS